MGRRPAWRARDRHPTLNLRPYSGGAQALGGAPGTHVTFLGVTKRAGECLEGARITSHSPDHVTFACLEAQHFLPEASRRRRFRWTCIWLLRNAPLLRLAPGAARRLSI